MQRKNGIWNYIKNYKFKSLLVQNFVLILLLVVVPFMGISFGIYRYYDQILLDEISAANRSSLIKVRDVMDFVVNEVDKLIAVLVTDRYIEWFLTKNKKVFPDYETIRALANISNTISIFARDYVESIYIYSDLNDYILSSISGGVAFRSFTDRDWYESYKRKSAENSGKWVLPRNANINTIEQPRTIISHFQRTQPISNFNNGGVIIVNLDYKKLKRLLGRNETERLEWVYILSDDGTVLFCTDEGLVGTTFELLLDQDMESLLDNESLIKMINNEETVFSYAKSMENSWQYLSVIPLSIYKAKMSAMRKFIAVAISLAIAVSLVVAFLISVRVFRPIRDIISMLDNPDEYFDVASNRQVKDVANEYKYIASNIIQTIDKSKYLETELNNRIQLLRQSQMSALQSQINPHFLHNTLQTINWLAMDLTNGENKASRVVNSLSSLLRVIMETESPLISLAEEIGYVKEYVDIQKVRYPDKFSINWEIDNEVLDYSIAKITLQPIIENALYHGIKPKRKVGKIVVRVKPRDELVVIEVIDDGVGMPEESIRDLNKELKTDYIRGDHQIGIKNVNQRTKLIYGETYGVTLSRFMPAGLRVKIVIPKVKIGDLFSHQNRE